MKKRQAPRRSKQTKTATGDLLEFPHGARALIVPAELHADIANIAREIGYTEARLLRCMLEEEISMIATAWRAAG